MDFIQSKRGGIVLCFNGFMYTKKHESKTADQITWRCVKRDELNCRVTLKKINFIFRGRNVRWQKCPWPKRPWPKCPGRNVRGRNVRGRNVLAETSVAEMSVAEMSEHQAKQRFMLMDYDSFHKFPHCTDVQTHLRHLRHYLAIVW